MDTVRSGRRIWLAQRLAISAFVAAHMFATVIWVMTESPLRRCCVGVVRYYILPLGMWHVWTMFAPDPVRDTVTLEADVVDSRGFRSRYAFTKCMDYPWWQAVPRFRHSKYGANLGGPDTEIPRNLAARHAVRQLAIPAAAFPVDVHLIYQIRPTPPPGHSPDEAASAMYPSVLATIHFASLSEVRP